MPRHLEHIDYGTLYNLKYVESSLPYAQIHVCLQLKILSYTQIKNAISQRSVLSVTMDFKTRVRNNGVKVKNVPNTTEEGGVFRFEDYVAKDPRSWGMVPQDPESVDVEAIAEEMYEIYEGLEEEFDEVTVGREDSDMYWATVEVDIPDDSTRQERVAEQVAEAILARQTI